MTADVETFKKIYFREFGIALTDKEAERKAQSLQMLYKAVYGSPAITKNYGNNNTNC
jgi:hypothetical protein